MAMIQDYGTFLILLTGFVNIGFQKDQVNVNTMTRIFKLLKELVKMTTCTLVNVNL